MESVHAQIPQTMNVKNKFMVSNNVPLNNNSKFNSNTMFINSRNDDTENNLRKELLLRMKSKFDKGEQIDIILNNSEESRMQQSVLKSLQIFNMLKKKKFNSQPFQKYSGSLKSYSVKN